MLKEIKLNYDFTEILKTDHETHKGSCIKHQVHELTDIHSEYGGFPPTYQFANTIIHQLWWDNTQLDFTAIGEQLGIEVITISTIKQPPGCVIPIHRDTFFLINQKYPDRKELKVRANIYLEDWKLGHMIQYQNPVEYDTSVKWKEGEGFMWDSSVLHLSANAGMEPKYTMQISGFLL